MADNVRQALKASKYSDGGTPKKKDAPPTPEDRALTIKHTSDSIPYNLHHAKDHLDELIKQLDRLCEYAPEKAEGLARTVCAELDKLYKQVEKHKGDSDGKDRS